MGGGGTDVRAAGEWVEGVCSVESDKWRVCCDPLHTASASPPPPHTFSSSGPSASNSRAQRSAPPSPSVPGPLPCRVSHSRNAPTFRREGGAGRETDRGMEEEGRVQRLNALSLRPSGGKEREGGTGGGGVTPAVQIDSGTSGSKYERSVCAGK